jgi:glycosyltransferase involved in cell wall biosynthesis
MRVTAETGLRVDHLKILFTHELFPPDVRGGGELTAFGAARSLRELGAEVRVLTTGNPAIREYDGFPTMRLPISRYRMNLAEKEIRRAAAGVDLIQTFNYHACLPSLAVGRAMGIPVVCMVLGLFGRHWREMKPFPLGVLWSAFERYQLLRPFDRIVFPSEFSSQLGIDLGVAPERAAVLYPGLEADKFAPSGRKEDVVLYTGKFERRKGVFEVIETARALPDIRFRLFGWGPAESDLRRGAPRNVEIETYEDSSNLPHELARARICLLPSKAETFGYSLIQAMASGCAIISTIPLPFEGVRVAPEDTPAMIEAVRGLWNAPETVQRMGQANVEAAARYDWKTFGLGLHCIYRKVIAARSS